MSDVRDSNPAVMAALVFMLLLGGVFAILLIIVGWGWLLVPIAAGGVGYITGYARGWFDGWKDMEQILDPDAERRIYGRES